MALSRRKRRTEPSQVISKHFEAVLRRIAADFLDSDSFHHVLSKGEEREEPIKSFLKNLLPDTFKITSGEVIDLYDKSSPQLDLMIYDAVRNFGFYSKSKSILPAEALLVSIEIKSILSSEEIRKSVKAAQKLYTIKPFKKPLSSPRIDGEAFDGRCRYFHCIFAYDSTIKSEEDYLKKEYDRYNNIITELSAPENIIDRIYVANKGMINPRKSWGLSEFDNPGRALMHFYLDMLNFLIRENNRRETVPYIAYIGQIGKTKWENLK
jgi:hypothetical protein